MQLAERLRIGQGQISRTENQTDLRLSTLTNYLNALGVAARLTITLPDGEIIDLDLAHPRKEDR